MNYLGLIAALAVAVIGVVSGVLARRETKAQKRRLDEQARIAAEQAEQQKESTSVNILTNLANTLRTELDRTTEDAAERLQAERDATKQLREDYQSANDRIVVLVSENRQIHVTAGRLADRVYQLEELCRRNQVPVPPDLVV